ncbi:hypothetical protein HZU83_16870 [Sphaerotilus montanus]|jgi:hypothetical protein|uniref:Lipoprotein n=2 Tax=Sphaerotilus montanus TaxID=522889 RepID=A0A7Y9QXX0_9BURK|nr:hypothetical protein [Sphaerotilus montanus]NYG33487.1 hypothetical protein [Sphaerotilus montanus]NZD58364.1 hypothetical protein [Sphaerotilus montanus]
MKAIAIKLGLIAPMFLAGCATISTQTYDQVREARDTSGPQGAVKVLEQAGGTDLLSQLEYGEMLRLASRHEDSLKAFQSADQKVGEWENGARSDIEKTAGMVLGAVVSERLTAYEGQDYEKVMLTVRMALDRMALGDWNTARVDIRRTHDREDLIAELRAKEYSKVEEKAKAESKTEGFQPIKLTEIDGYPVKSIQDPRLSQLKNGYQNALGHYLSGFLYEALQEPSLAAPGYQRAAELSPGSKLPQQALATLDRRVARATAGQTDVLFLIEHGEAPRLVAKSFAIPYGIGGVGVPKFFQMSIPYFDDMPSKSAAPSQITVGGRSLKLEPIVDFGLMANRSLKDRMPGILLRGFIRGAAKAVVRDKVNERNPLLGLAVTLATVASEVPDDRTWRGLPQRIYIARAQMPEGEHTIRIDGVADAVQPVRVAGRYAVVPIRIIGSRGFNTGVALLNQGGAVTASSGDTPGTSADSPVGGDAGTPSASPIAVTPDVAAPAAVRRVKVRK